MFDHFHARAPALDVSPTLDLDQPRDVGALLGTTFRVWFEHFGVLLALALVVVVPVAGLVDGLWAGTLGDPDTLAPFTAQLGSWLAWTLLIPSLVTAMHVVAVQDLGEGRRPSFRRAGAAALRVAPSVVVVVLVSSLVTGVGFVACVIPGVYVAVRWYFGAQAVVALGKRGQDALSVSEDLTRERWWWTFGALLLFYAIAAVPTAVVTAVTALVDVPAVAVVVQLLAGGITVSFTALAGTLLFFSLRARGPASE